MSNARFEKKYNYYSGASITLFFPVCQILQHKHQLLLSAVVNCLGYKQVWCFVVLFFTQVYVVEAAEVLSRVPLVKASWGLIAAVGCKISVGTEISVSFFESVHIAGAAPQANNPPRLRDLLNASAQSFS